MKDENILVILYAPANAESTRRTIHNALQTAVQASRLSFALPKYAQRETEDFLQKNRLSYLYFDNRRGIASIVRQEITSNYFLLFMGCGTFLQGWDALLLMEFQENHSEKLLLTASVWSGSEEKAEVCLPALKSPFDENGITIGRGLPLVCAKFPVSTLLADPALLFGKANFLKKVCPAITSLSYLAYQAGYDIRLMTRPYFRPTSVLPVRKLKRPVPTVLGGTTFDRFEKSCGIHWNEKSISYKALFGMNELQPIYAQQLSLRQQFSLRMEARKNKSIAVTGFIDFPKARQNSMNYCLFFNFLSRLKNLPLLVFTGGSTEKLVRTLHPNNQNFRERDCHKYDGMSIEEHFRYSKIMMLKRVAECTPTAKYLYWVDFDILPHPMPELAVPNEEALTDGRIHLATVDGEPDTSFIYLPADRIRLIWQETISIVETDDIFHRGFSEINLWKRIISRHRDVFTLHPMPRRQLLFLSCFDPNLLSKQITMYFYEGET